MFVLIVDGLVKKYPYNLTDLRLDNPSVSFPSYVSDSTMEEFNAFRVYYSEVPAYDKVTQTLEEDVPVFDTTANRWTQQWKVRSYNQTEIENKSREIRDQRNDLLSQCDWTQVLDAPVDRQAWSNYRQFLRDITAQSGFPFDVVWPQQP